MKIIISCLTAASIALGALADETPAYLSKFSTLALNQEKKQDN